MGPQQNRNPEGIFLPARIGEGKRRGRKASEVVTREGEQRGNFPEMGSLCAGT